MQRRAVADAILIAIAARQVLRFSPGRYRAFGRHHGHELHIGFERKRGNWIVGKTAL
jgi:hypothetical protein